MLFWSIFLVGEIFQVYEVYLFFRCFFKTSKVSEQGELLAYVGLLGFRTIPYIMLGTPIFTILGSFIGGILVTCIYHGSWKKKLLCGTFFYVIFAFAEAALAMMTGFVHVDLFQSEYYFSIFGIVGLPIVGFLLVLLLRNFKHIKDGEDVSVSYWVMSIALPVCSLTLFLLFYRQPELHSVDLFICVAILFILNVFVFYMYNHQMETMRISQEREILEMQNQLQLKQLDIMNEVLGQARSQKHEFGRHISMISHMNKQGETKRLAEYLGEIQGNLDEKKWVDSGNLVLDGILNLRMQRAMQAQIPMEVEVKVPDALELSVYDMNVLLGNLLDNSLEAQAGMEEPFVQVKIRYTAPRLCVRICNAYREVVTDEKGKLLTTKVEKKELHGYGLLNVRKVLKKYAGDMQIERKDGVFDVFAYCEIE